MNRDDVAQLLAHMEWADSRIWNAVIGSDAALRDRTLMERLHHRGQLATMIRQLGAEPPLVDFIGWVWMGKPEPAWEALTSS